MKNKFYTSKKMYLVFTFLFLWLSFASMKAQTIELVSNVGINYPNAVALNGDQLYFCEITLGGGGDLGVIDINETFPALVTTVLSDLGSLAGLLVIGDELYITINSQNKVVKIDLTSPNPTPVDVTTTINSAYGLIQNGNDLYISTDDGNNGIYKIDLAGPIPQMPVQVLAGFNTAGMVIKGDELYYSSYSGTSISKINLSLSNPTPELVIDGLSGPDGMVLNGNFLYVSEFHGDRISRIDLGQSNLVAETFVSGVSGPSLGVFDGVNFYFAEHDSDEISRVVIIDPLLSSFSPVCFNAMPDNLGGASPAGGTYSGENITDNGDGETFTFDAASAGVGMHTVTYTISGQTVTSTIEVVIPVEINVVGQEHVTCNGAANGSIFTTTLNGTGAFSYIWSNGSTSAQLSAVSGGTYSVTVSDANGCTSTASGTITEPTALEVSMTVDANTCAGLETGAATASATGGTLPYTYGWFGGTASVTGLGVGAYDITVFDDNNCQITSSVSIIEFPPTVVTFDSSGPFDIGAGIQSALGGGSPTGGVYSGPGVTDDGNGMTYSFDPMVAGVGAHIVSYALTDANACDGDASATISVVAANEPGNECSDAFDINSLFSTNAGEVNTSGLYDNSNYTSEASDPAITPNCFYDEDIYQKTIWYTFTGNGGTYNIKSVECNATNYITNGDTQAAIYTGDCMNPVIDACNDDDDFANFNIDFETQSGVEYRMIVDGYSGFAGEFCLQVTNLMEPPPPAGPGNECSDALDINSLFSTNPGEVNTSGLYDNSNYTSEVSDPSVNPNCFFNDDAYQKTIWYTFTGNGATYSIKSVECNATNYIPNGDTQAAIYTGDCMSPAFIACNGNESGDDLNFIIEIATEVGVEYRMVVDGFDGVFGEYCVQVTNLTQPAAFPDLTAVCVDAGIQNGLGGATPTGGSYSGTAVTDDGNGMTFSFDPSTAGVGIHNITYTALNGSTAIATIEVNGLPNVTFAGPGTFTIDAGVQTGLSGGTPTGGIYSGLGVTDDGNGMTYTFDPALAGVGNQTLTYSFTDANSCSSSATGEVTVEGSTLTDDECGGANDINVLFGGPVDDPQISGLFDNTDYDADGDPSDGYECWAEPGGASLENTIWYTFTGDGNTYRLRTIECSATNYNNDTQVAIYSGDCTNPTPIVCNDDEDLDGGIYNIKVEFSTEVGVTYLVMIDGYSGSDGEFCLEVTNLGEAVAFLALDAICVDAGTTSYGGATPEGGTYSGPGVSDDGNGMTFSFDPAAAGAGSHNITYTSNSGLTGTSTIEVFSLPTVSFTTSGTIDINDGVQTGLGGGTPTGGVYSGSGVTDDGNGMSYSFDPVAAGVGDHSITYSFTDANGCNNAAMDDVTVSDMVDVDNLLDRLVYVYPNPTSGLVYFKGMVPEEVKVVDALGRLLSSQTLLRNELDLSGLPSGVYTLLVTFEDMEQRKLRVVKE